VVDINKRRNPSMLRKIGIIAVLSLIVAAVAAVPALAANPHQVPNNPIVCEEVQVQGDPAVRCSGSIAGLGGADRVTISIDAALACETRQGNNQPGGHLQADTQPLTVRGGRVNFSETTDAADCPRGLNPVVGNTATITVREFPSGDVLRTFTETILP
jgi:hypothetical protein